MAATTVHEYLLKSGNAVRFEISGVDDDTEALVSFSSPPTDADRQEVFREIDRRVMERPFRKARRR